MVAKDTLFLTIDAFSDVVVKKIFTLLSLGWYLFTVVNQNTVMEMHFQLLPMVPMVMYLLLPGNTSGKHTTFWILS